MWILLYALLGLLVLFALVSVVTWLLYVPMIVRVFGEMPWLQAESGAPAPDAEPCEFTTADGLTLRGSYLRTTAPVRLGVIGFCHEYSGDRWGAVPYTNDLRAQGYDVFTFDFRNHGESDLTTGYQPMPWLTHYELADVRAAVDYLTSRDDADPAGIGLLGVSRGANAALCAAAGDSRVRAVVTDGAFPIGAMQRHYVRRFMDIYITPWWIGRRLPDVCLMSYCGWAKLVAGWQQNCRFASPEQFTRRVRQPVFMIHGERDAYIPLDVVHNLRSSLAGRSKLWVVPGVKHNGAIKKATREYHRRIARFFEKHLAGGRERAETLRRAPAAADPRTFPNPQATGRRLQAVPYTSNRDAPV
jgi:uncharacterized protein